MKNLYATLFLFFLTFSIYAQESANVYFLRQTEKTGSLRNFKLFADDQLICTIKNNSYIVQSVEPGTHLFSAQIGGKKAKSTAEHFELDIEANKTYYLEVVTHGSTIGSTSFLEITENTAKVLLPKLKEQADCK